MESFHFSERKVEGRSWDPDELMASRQAERHKNGVAHKNLNRDALDPACSNNQAEHFARVVFNIYIGKKPARLLGPAMYITKSSSIPSRRYWK